MAITDKALGRILNDFYLSEIKGLEAAAGKAVKVAAKRTADRSRAEIRRNFEETDHPQSKSFFRAVKVYNLEPQGDRGFASYVRLGVPFMGVFQEGATITPSLKKALVIRLTAGRRLGFPRINDKKTLSDVLARIPKNRWFIRKKGLTAVVFYKKGPGDYTPIYKVQPAVVIKKMLSFLEIAEEEAALIPELIERLTNG